MSKITIKHYLNKNLKSKKENGIEVFPVYVQVIYNRTVLKFKSDNSFFEYLNDDLLESEAVKLFLKSEILNVERCVNILSLNAPKLLTSKDIYRLSKPLHHLIEENFKKLIKKEINQVPKVLTELSYTDLNDLLFFLDGYFKLDEASEKVENVRTCINCLRYFHVNEYNINYIVADLYFGENYKEIYNNIFSENCDEQRTENLIKDFRYFAEL